MPLADDSPSNQTASSANRTPSTVTSSSSSNPSTGTSSSNPSTIATDRTASSSGEVHSSKRHVWEGNGLSGGDGIAVPAGSSGGTSVVNICRGGFVTQVVMSEPAVEGPVVARPGIRPKPTIVDPLIAFKSMSHEEQVASLPFCLIDKELTLEEFHAQRDTLEGVGCSRCEFRNGGAWIYELAHAAHDGAAAEIIHKLVRQLGNHDDDFNKGSSPTCDNNDANWSFEPDGSLTILDYRPGPNNVDAADSSGNRWPNLIVEVAYSETEDHVHAKALEWLNTAQNPDHGVQQVIVIRLQYPGLTDGHRTMKAWRHERGADDDPVQEIEFGNHGPDKGFKDKTDALFESYPVTMTICSCFVG